MTSAFGKIILFGEHAVVHGFPAIAAALEQTVECHVVGSAPRLRLRISDWNLDTDAGAESVGRALAAIGSALGVRRADIQGRASVPMGAGLGSSAAMAVSVTRALVTYANLSLTREEVESVANTAERIFHTNPSGVDVAVSSRGGVGEFRAGIGLSPLPCGPLTLAVGVSGEARVTGELVEHVQAELDRAHDSTWSVLSALGSLTEQARPALATNDGLALGGLMTRAHELLASLGLSSPGLDDLVRLALEAGAYGAKLSGAGGGGAVIAVAPNPHAVVQRWQKAGYWSRCSNL